MVTRLRLTLEQEEYTALLEVAAVELRNPGDQARYMLRRELERRGLLTAARTIEAIPAGQRAEERYDE